jgi:hypothetical protein
LSKETWASESERGSVRFLPAGARPPLVLELCTSEGCSSCPPADRWLSSLRPGAALLPLAFHVNYWNRLGWTDRFASTDATQRQYDLARAMGAPYVCTPQVVAGGHDWRRWPAYWAVLEDGHRSRVTAGENSGATLTHDHVVRLLQPLSAWIGGARRFELALPPSADGRPQRVAFVVEDAATRRPVQALACR